MFNLERVYILDRVLFLSEKKEGYLEYQKEKQNSTNKVVGVTLHHDCLLPLEKREILYLALFAKEIRTNTPDYPQSTSLLVFLVFMNIFITESSCKQNLVKSPTSRESSSNS